MRSPVHRDMLTTNGMDDAKSCICETSDDDNESRASESIVEEVDVDA